MARRYYLTPVVGQGTEEDPYRLRVADHGVDHAAIIPTDAVGRPTRSWGLAPVDATDFTALNDDATLAGLPQLALGTQLSTQQRRAAQSALDRFGAAVIVKAGDTLGDVVARVAQALDLGLRAA